MFPSPSPVRKKNLKRAAPCPVLGSGEPCIGSLTTARIATSIAPPSQNAPPVRKQSELAEREYWKPYMPPCVQEALAVQLSAGLTEVCVPPQDDVLSVYGCTYLKDVDDGADDKGFDVVKLESIKA
eukprot:gene843-33575_t